MTKKLSGIVNKDWSLFLDRDGVINVRPLNDYVKSPDEFIFIPEALKAIKILSDIFGKTFVVTNQQGVGLGLMTQTILDEIHQILSTKVTENGGRIDHIYSCTDVKTKVNSCRKPSIEMALKAKDEFPAIDFSKSIIVGDTASDIEFGRNAGMFCVLIGDEETSIEPDLRFDALISFANYLID
ncbi:MAG: HAD-IIIA family hydrolase [Bacteroidales bacterium]|nr:HAD-IIIA family hydrolase [Bacteroidales bacterium]